MGKDNLFHKRRKEREERKHDFREPKMDSFLIVTEGKCTEPYYFMGIKEKIKKQRESVLEIKNLKIPEIEIKGQGYSTSKLVEITEQIVKDAPIFYQQVWIIFDKDDFQDFDEAIFKAQEKGYQVAWSNESFEYWLYLHFGYSDTAFSRQDWNKKLSEIFKKEGIKAGKYEKNEKEIFQIVSKYGSVEMAIKRSKKRLSGFKEGKSKPSDFNPATKVYQLVEMLYQYLE